jgi:hypothetical protein
MAAYEQAIAATFPRLTKKPAGRSTRRGHSSKANASDQSINPSSSSDVGPNAVKTDPYGMPSMLAAEDVVNRVAAQCDFVDDRTPSGFGRSAADPPAK